MPSITRADSRADQKTSRLSRILCAAVAAMCTTVASAEVRVLTWSPIDASVESELTSMVSAYPGANPRTIAAELNRRPAGKRALLYLNSTGILGTHPADACRVPDGKGGTMLTTWPGPWTSSGARDLLATSTAFFKALRAEGAMIDSLILDEEFDFAAGRYIRADYKNMDAIQADSRFVAIAKRLGFRDLRKVMWGTPEYHRWNEVLLADFDAALERSVVAPFRALWPTATVSNYRSAPIARRFMTPDSAGHGIVRGGRGVGTHNSIEFYGMVLRWLNGAPFAGTRLGDGAFDLLRMNVHKLRGATATNGKPMMPWIASYGLGTRETDCMDAFVSGLSGNSYWNENVIQLAMHGCDTILLYNPHAWHPSQIAANCNTVEDQQLLASIVGDINSRLGAAAGTSRWFTLPGLQDRVMATGRRVSGGTLWRFSFAPGVASVVVSLKNGEVREVLPEEGGVGAWYFESDSEPLATKTDGTDVAFVEAAQGSEWPDLDEDSALTEGDLSLMLLDMDQESTMDLDGDGVVTQRDVNRFRANQAGWRQKCAAAQGVRPGSVLVSRAN